MTVEALSRSFRDATREWAEHYEHGRARKANHAYARWQALAQQLRDAGPPGARAMLALLDDDDDDDAVRVCAGIQALGIAPELAEPVLRAIADKPRGMMAFEAERILLSWRAGTFVVTPWER